MSTYDPVRFTTLNCNKVNGLLFALKFHSVRTHGKNGFVTETKLGTTNNFFVAAATKRFVDRTKHFVVTKYFLLSLFLQMILLV